MCALWCCWRSSCGVGCACAFPLPPFSVCGGVVSSELGLSFPSTESVPVALVELEDPPPLLVSGVGRWAYTDPPLSLVSAGLVLVVGEILLGVLGMRP